MSDEVLIETAMRVMRVGEPAQAQTVMLPHAPGYDRLREVVEPLLDGCNMERVNVLHEGRYTDMFVDETGALKSLPRNDEATAIYRNNWLTHNPGTDPESMPAIYGTAVLFGRRVWF